MTAYTVKWEVEVNAGTAIEAAQEAREFQLDRFNEHTTFEVGTNGDFDLVDLEDLPVLEIEHKIDENSVTIDASMSFFINDVEITFDEDDTAKVYYCLEDTEEVIEGRYHSISSLLGINGNCELAEALKVDLRNLEAVDLSKNKCCLRSIYDHTTITFESNPVKFSEICNQMLLLANEKLDALPTC